MRRRAITDELLKRIGANWEITLIEKEQDKLSAAQQAGEGAWEDLKEGLENSWDILKMSFNKAKSEFEKGYKKGTKE